MDSSSLRYRYGICGNFQGDDALEESIRSFEERCGNTIPFELLVTLSDKLPPKGRQALSSFLAKNISTPNIDQLLTRLLDYCLINAATDASGISTDEDFVLIPTQELEMLSISTTSNRCTDTAHPLRYAQWQILLALIDSASPKKAAELCQQYLWESSSTRYRSSFLSLMVSNPEISNSQIVKLYKRDTTIGQSILLKKIVKLRKESRDQKLVDMRIRVLETLLDDNVVPNTDKYLYEASSEYVRKKLEENPILPLKNWSLHKKIYLSELKQRLETCRIDKNGPPHKKQKTENSINERCINFDIDRIKCGEVWDGFIEQISKGFDEDAVESLIQLIMTFVPCRVKPSLPLNVQQHLKKISELGEEDILEFDNDIEKVTLKKKLLSSVSRETRKQKALEAMNAANFDEFKYWIELVDTKTQLKLLLVYYPEVAGKQELLKYIMKKNMSQQEIRNASKNKEQVVVDPFFSFFSDLLNNNYVSQVYLTMETFKTWHQLHKNSTPELCPNSASQNTPVITWEQWFDSYMMSQKEYSQTLSSLLVGACQKLRPLDDSQISLYASALKFLVESTNEAVEIARDHLSTEFLFQSAWQNFVNIYIKICKFDRSAPRKLHDLFNMLEILVQNECLIYLNSCLNFDPRSQLENGYADHNKIDKASRMLMSLIDASKSESILGACFTVCSDWLFRSSKDGNHESTQINKKRFYIQKDIDDKSGKIRRSFIFVDSNVHKSGIEASIRCLKSIVSKKEASITVKRQIWMLLKQYPKAANIDCNLSFVTFILSLPPELQNENIEEIKRRSSIELQKVMVIDHSPILSALKFTNLLHEILDDCVGIEAAVRDAILQQYGPFHNEAVQVLLKEETKAPTAEERSQAYATWLNRAFSTLESPSEFVNPLNYVVIQIKNESGQHKRAVFATICTLVPQIVTKTLKHSDIDSATKLCQILVQVVQDDLNRRDSIASRYLESISYEIMRIILHFDPRKKLIDVRKIWISTSIKIQWLFTMSNGDVKEFLLPIRCAAHPESNWIDQDKWDKTFPHRQFPEKLAEIRKVISLKECVQRYNKDKVFGLNDAVNSIVDGMASIWDFSKYGNPFDVESKNFDDEMTMENNLRRVKQLFGICGLHWEESDFLVQCFDALLGTSLRNSIDEQFAVKDDFLKTLFLQCRKERNTKLVGRLSEAVDRVFHYAIENGLECVAGYWFQHWTDSQLYTGRDQWKSIDTRISRLLVAYGLEPEGTKANAAQLYNKKCLFLKNILSSTSSAILDKKVWDTMLECRPDILSEYCIDGAIHGVFKYDQKAPSNAISHLYDKIVGSRSTRLHMFPPGVCAELAQYALNLCLDTEKDMSTRVHAAEVFSTCITTSNTQIVQLLDNKALEPPIVEAITLKIFTLDGPWLIMGYLLNVEMLQRRNQSTTASLLRHISKHVPVHHVVKTLSLLLSSTRRKALGISLTKAIVRLLFEAGSPSALQLLDVEWQNKEIHKDVRSEILLMCLRSVAEKENNDGDWEWNKLYSVVGEKNVEEDTGLLILSVLLGQAGVGLCGNRWKVGRSFQPPTESPTIEALRDTFTVFISSSKNLEARSKFFALAEKLSLNLQQPDLKRAAALIKWKLSALFVDESTSDDRQNTIQQMKNALLEESDLDELWHDDWIVEVSSLYATAVERCASNTVKQSSTLTAYSMTADDWSKIYDTNEVTKQASSFVKSLVMNSNSGGRLVQRRRWKILNSFSQTAALSNLKCFKDEPVMKTLQLQMEDAEFISRTSYALFVFNNADHGDMDMDIEGGLINDMHDL